MPVSFELYSLPTFRDVQMRFARATTQLLKDKQDMMGVMGRRMVVLMQEEAPKGRTGKYRKGIKFRTFIEATNKVGFRIYTPEPLTTWIVEGTKPHPIPKAGGRGAKTLKFLWEKGPRSSGKFTAFHFFKSVMHPGTKPNPYPKRAYRRWLPAGKQMLKYVGTRFVSSVKGSGTTKYHGGKAA